MDTNTKPLCTVRYHSEVPGIAEAGSHPVVQCRPTHAHASLRQTAVAGNMWLGSDQDGTPSGKTGAKKKEITGWQNNLNSSSTYSLLLESSSAS